eukprot:TRINITY_DN71869_c0_g1_i1.p1 TRINITY_DN71869_c0_g1~~TRINITY_DN71869_c0_g1_i1.p1  ORF type:complete len:813 (-),score=156.81 TRINITY_DN71869_c0_g1_i1:226-2610(-)
MAASRPVVGFIGLGAMGGGMASALLKKGFSLRAFDVFPAAVAPVVAAGARGCATAAECADGADVLVIMTVNCEQAESVLFGAGAGTASLKKGAVVVLTATVAPAAARALGKRVEEAGFYFVDAPVSGGVVKAGEGTLTIMAGGSDEAMARAKPVLDGMSEHLFHMGEVGNGSSMKMVNQLLAGVHIAAAGEAMALAAKAGLDTRQVHDIIVTAAGNSWMFENRVPRMLDEEYLPAKSKLSIWVKDLSIVLGEAKELTMPCPLASIAHQQYLLGAASGHADLDDSAIVKIFGQSVAAPAPKAGQRRRWPSRSLASALAELPPVPTTGEDMLEEVRSSIRSGSVPKLVVLDDDPTGTQTVAGVSVLTKWSQASIEAELTSPSPGFFIMTNSRSLPTEEARVLTREVCELVKAAAAKVGATCTVVLRGDSTLRGHYPAEVDAAAEVMGDFDVTVLCPFFLQGGRYTIQDVHYVATGDRLDPASETEFAKDKAFGYTESNLCDWVEEKTGGRIAASNVASISIADLRKGGPEVVKSRLLSVPKGAVLIVNAAAEADLYVFSAGLLRAEASGLRICCRTAASFVSARLGINAAKAVPVTPARLPSSCQEASDAGGLVMVGSYVAKSTAQVKELIKQRGSSLSTLEVPVSALLRDGGEAVAKRTAEAADELLRKGQDVLIMTSRELVHGADARESLEIGNKVSQCLVQILRLIQTRPRYLLAKGGITSADLGTKGLGSEKALVAGQALPGIPVWLLGATSRWVSFPYIVFPGNVGAEDGMAKIVESWAARPPQLKMAWWD